MLNNATTVCYACITLVNVVLVTVVMEYIKKITFNMLLVVLLYRR